MLDCRTFNYNLGALFLMNQRAVNREPHAASDIFHCLLLHPKKYYPNLKLIINAIKYQLLF